MKAMEASEKRFHMAVWSVFSAALIAGAVISWRMIFGSVPIVYEVWLTREWLFSLPLAFSSFWYVIIGPIFSIPMVFLFSSEKFRTEKGFRIGLILRLILVWGCLLIVQLIVMLVDSVIVAVSSGFGDLALHFVLIYTLLGLLVAVLLREIIGEKNEEKIMKIGQGTLVSWASVFSSSIFLGGLFSLVDERSGLIPVLTTGLLVGLVAGIIFRSKAIRGFKPTITGLLFGFIATLGALTVLRLDNPVCALMVFGLGIWAGLAPFFISKIWRSTMKLFSRSSPLPTAVGLVS